MRKTIRICRKCFEPEVWTNGDGRGTCKSCGSHDYAVIVCDHDMTAHLEQVRRADGSFPRPNYTSAQVYVGDFEILPNASGALDLKTA